MGYSFDGSSLQADIESFVKERFAAFEILSVEIEEDCERDGERILEIRINFRGTPRELAQREPPGFLRSLQDKLRALHEPAFPLVSYRPVAA